MNYYNLPKDKQWMGDDNPYSIGGYNSEISQIGYTLTRLVKEWYPINSIPSEIEHKLAEVTHHLEVSERLISDLIGIISKNISTI